MDIVKKEQLLKANEGKRLQNSMIEGYKDLNSNVSNSNTYSRYRDGFKQKNKLLELNR